MSLQIRTQTKYTTGDMHLYSKRIFPDVFSFSASSLHFFAKDLLLLRGSRARRRLLGRRGRHSLRVLKRSALGQRHGTASRQNSPAQTPTTGACEQACPPLIVGAASNAALARVPAGRQLLPRVGARAVRSARAVFVCSQQHAQPDVRLSTRLLAPPPAPIATHT